TVIDTLPAGVTFVAASNGGAQAAGKVTWVIPNLAPGAGGSLTIDVTCNAPGTFLNSASGTYTSGGMMQVVASNITSTSYDAPNLAVAVSGPAQSGTAQVTYTVSWTNSGPGTALGVTVSDTLPIGAQFVSASGGGKLAGGVVTWSV